MTPEAKKALYKQLSQPFPEEALERTLRKVVVRELNTSSRRKAYEAGCDLVLELGEWIDGTLVLFAEALADGGHDSASEADARKGDRTRWAALRTMVGGSSGGATGTTTIQCPDGAPLGTLHAPSRLGAETLARSASQGPLGQRAGLGRPAGGVRRPGARSSRQEPLGAPGEARKSHETIRA